MQTYQPNFTEQRVQTRCQQIILWAERYIGSETRGLNSRVLRSPEAFGDSPLGRYIKNCLLVKVNPAFQPGVFSQQYRINVDYLNYLRAQVGLPKSPLRAHRIIERFANQADSFTTGDFDYNKAGARWYNGLQNIPRAIKAQEFADRGLMYDYDIECCAPTLLLQQARRLKPSLKTLDYIDYYLTNKSLVRNELSIKYNLSSRQVKQVINGLFQGGILNFYEHNQVLKHLNGNTYTMSQLKQDQFLLELQKDIRYMWKILRISMRVETYTTSKGLERTRRINGSDRTKFYQVLEEQVMTPIWKYMKKKKVVHYKEHDGFRSSEFVDPNELEQLIKRTTGFDVKFNWTKIESNIKK